MIAACLIMARAVHFASCLLILGVWIFDRFMAAPVARQGRLSVADYWDPIVRRLVLLALPAALVSGIAWFVLVAIDISGLAPVPAMQAVWSHTDFIGPLWKVRTLFWCASGFTAVPALFLNGQSTLRSALVWIALFSSAGLAVSLAWTGHGHGEAGIQGQWHLCADALHLLVVGFWPIGLVPFCILFSQLRRMPDEEKWLALAHLTNRFSLASLASAILLALTGLANSWFLVGSVSNLFSTTYGRVLIAKVVGFFLMVILGAVNLIYLKPNLLTDSVATTGQKPQSVAARLQFNVMMELVLMLAVLVLVAILGILPPATE
jgi:putative copper export protein